MHLLLSVRANVYSTQRRLFACLGELLSEPPPLVTEIPNKAFTSRCSVHAVPRVDNVNHLGGISTLDWHTKPCERDVKSAGTEYVELACQGLTFIPQDCASWLLRREPDGPLNVFKALAGLFPLLTVREPPFGEALDWLQFTYTADRAGAYVAPASMVLSQSAVAEGDELFPALLAHLTRLYPEVYGPEVATGWMPERPGISQETSMARPKHIPSYCPSKFPSCAPRHTPVSNYILSHPLPHTHPTPHINHPSSLLPLAPPVLHLTHEI